MALLTGLMAAATLLGVGAQAAGQSRARKDADRAAASQKLELKAIETKEAEEAKLRGLKQDTARIKVGSDKGASRKLIEPGIVKVSKPRTGVNPVGLNVSASKVGGL